MTYKTKMYFSGSMSHPQVVERLISTGVHRLFTFASPLEAPDYLRRCTERGLTCSMIVDSGAFTSWSIGKPVKLEELLAYDRALSAQYPQHDLTFIGLDVIPGQRGRMAAEAEIRLAVEESYSNFIAMQQELAGRVVLPVFHSGEGKEVRNRYMDHTDYLCLSPNQNLTEQQRLLWARESFVPGLKFHGLATTGNAMLSQIDWYSVDSSGWLMTAAMGCILLPVGRSLKPLPVSSTAPAAKEHGKHLNNMTEAPWIREYIITQGYDPERLMTEYADRICWNIDQWNRPPWQKNIVQPLGLFH